MKQGRRGPARIRRWIGVGKWFFKGTDERTPEGGFCHGYEPLFNWLETREKEFRTMKVTLDEKTATAVADASKAAGDTSALTKVVPGENELSEMDARGLWFTLQILCDQQGTPDDAVEGSSESYFGTLKDHPAALDVLRNDLREFAPKMDLMSDQTGLKDKLADH
mgnify:CR=1 FL=1|tara:strand:- start:10297 stop:10791 length:495 start_codon:yes stop_codon:yes gene_type:complete